MTKRQLETYDTGVRAADDEADLPAQKPLYHQLDEVSKDRFWDSRYNLDVASKLFEFANNVVVIKTNFHDENIGRVMAQTFRMACIYAWEYVIAKRRFNKAIGDHPLEWLQQKGKLEINIKSMYAKIRDIEKESWDELLGTDEHPGGIGDIWVRQSGSMQGNRPKRPHGSSQAAGRAKPLRAALAPGQALSFTLQP